MHVSMANMRSGARCYGNHFAIACAVAVLLLHVPRQHCYCMCRGSVAIACAAAVLLFAGVGLIACGATLLGSYTCGQTAFELAVAEAEEASRPATVDSSRMLRRLHDTDELYANTTCQPGLQGHCPRTWRGARPPGL